VRGVSQQLDGFVSSVLGIIVESGFQMESANTCYTVQIFLQGIFQRLFGSTASGFCTGVLRAVGTSTVFFDR
jgi:hypothetical protein